MQPKKPVSTRNVLDQCGRASYNMMCKMFETSQDYLLDQLKHFSEAVMDIKRNSIGTRPSCRHYTWSNRILSKLVTRIVTRLYYRPQQQYRAEGRNFAENVQHQKEIQYWQYQVWWGHACCRLSSRMCQVRPCLEWTMIFAKQLHFQDPQTDTLRLHRGRA